MKDQIQELLTQIVQMIQTGFDFVQAELPIFIQEVLTYWTFQAWFNLGTMILFMITFSIIGIKLIKFSFKISNYESIENEDLCEKYENYFRKGYEQYSLGFGILSLCFALGFLLGILLDSIPVVLQATFAPRLFLLEKLKELM